MYRMWIRDVETNDLHKVPLLKCGSENWKDAFKEMTDKGYRFEIGNAKGESGPYCGLYLLNTLDIEIEPSEYEIVNLINKKIKATQDFVKSLKVREEQNGRSIH